MDEGIRRVGLEPAAASRFVPAVRRRGKDEQAFERELGRKNEREDEDESRAQDEGVVPIAEDRTVSPPADDDVGSRLDVTG